MAFLFRLSSRLPLPVLHNLGAALGWLVWLLSSRYRRLLRENIEAAGFAHVRTAAIAEAGKGIAELPFVWGRPVDEVLASIHGTEGWQIVEAARAEGRPLLFLTPHLGCFEILGPFLGSRGPLTALYRQSRLPWAEALIREGRGRSLTLAAADRSGVRMLLSALKRKEAVILLPDQVPGQGEGVWAPFFGRPAFTMTLAARLTEIEGVVPVFAFAERLLYGAGYRLHFRAPATPLAGDLPTRVARINAEIEDLVRACPEQYLWSYNRYKRPAGATAP